MQQQPPRDRDRNQQRVNEQIRISPVRLIGINGEQLGVVPTSQALDMAREANLDLVEVAPTERPPVCKILDYGKFRYQQSRDLLPFHFGHRAFSAPAKVVFPHGLG